MKFFLRFTRLVYSKKLPDRFLSCQIVSGSDVDRPGKRGMIVTLVEIKSPWYHTSKLGQQIANQIAREYYRGVSSSDINNFENAVKNVNEFISQESEGMTEKDWPTKTNAFLGLIIDNDVHFTQTGTVWSDIVRKGKLLKVSEPDPAYIPNPDSFFSSLTSGSLEDDDVLLIGTKRLANHLMEMPDIINHPSELAGDIVSAHSDKGFYAGALVQVTSKDVLSEKKTGRYPETIYLDQPFELVGKRLNYTFTHAVKPLAARTGQGVSQGASKAAAFWRSTVAPKLKENTTKVTASATAKFKQSHPKEAQLEHEETNAGNFNINYYSKQAKQATRAALIKSDFLVRKTKRLIPGIGRLATGPKKMYLLGGILALILIIIIGFRFSHRTTTTDTQNLTVQLAQISKQSDEARQAVVYGDTAKAKTILTDAIAQLQDLKKSGADTKTIDSEIAKLTTQLDDLDKVTRLTSSDRITAPKDARFAVMLSGKAWAITKTGAIYSSPVAGGTFESTKASVAGTPIAVAPLEKQSSLYVLTENAQMFLFDTKTGTVEPVTVNGGAWISTASIAQYVGNLYAVDSEQGQISKYASDSSNFKAPSNYLTKALPGLKTITVDGSIYGLTNEGVLYKIEKSKPTAITLSNLPDGVKLAGATKISTSPDRDKLYISIGSHLIELTKDGKFIVQYSFDNGSTIDDFYMNEKGLSIWVLTNGALGSYTLK